MGTGDLEFSKFEASARFTSPAYLPLWSGNALRSGFGARLRDLVCLSRGELGQKQDCSDCLHRDICVYDFFYNPRPPAGAKVLRRQSDPPRPFTFEPPESGGYNQGDKVSFGFTLFGKGMQYLPYFLLALRNLGESGLGSGYKEGQGKYVLESVDSLGYGTRANIFSGDTIFNRSILLSYRTILKASKEHVGKIALNFIAPTQIKENDRFTAAPSFRGFMSKLLSRANVLAEFYGSGGLFSSEEALRILGECRSIAITSAATNEIWEKRYFHKQKQEKRPLAPFFTGKITYSGEFSQEMMALLELGTKIHVGKMVTFGNGGYEIII
ncbi:MAG: CRISPR system precrRNA processing endoribonuclease RAMP protein Cas6 [Methanotrichaceae archaeon]